ncbi:unnamed protein product [Oikopleura dioica]|uniref:Uncharacterized protein n=1 Tax=Oikopleura dioica TaxID=34765 RepID=E4XEG0_OIKDI|nr:unnamed protein product [Oikopleura dioica]
MDHEAPKTIEIPIRNSEEVIELECASIPDAQEVLNILSNEVAPMRVWLEIALEFWRQDRRDEFQRVLEEARSKAGKDYMGHEKDTMRCLDTLAAYNVICGKQEVDKEKQTKFFMEATTLYTLADKVIMYDQSHLLGRACFCLLDKGDQLDQADNQFNFVLDQDLNSIPALLGKACIAFNKRDFKGALGHYKKCLRLNPGCPADIRLGMGLCFYRMNKIGKAVDAFTRALEIDKRCLGALVGLAVVNLNDRDVTSVRDAITLFSSAYKIDKKNALVHIHLANHFFFRNQIAKAQQLAFHALHHTEHQQIRAEACYQLGRCHHKSGDYEQAFRYYNQAANFSTPKYALPFYYLGCMYLQRGSLSDIEQAIILFEKILKEYPNEHDTMKVLGHLYANSTDPEKCAMAKTHLEKVVAANPKDWEALIDYAQVLEQFTPEKALETYRRVIQLMEAVGVEVRAEIYNNIGTLQMRLGNLDDARENLQLAEEQIKILLDGPEYLYYRSLHNTVKYNSARLREKMYDFDKAIWLYKEIVNNNPKYIDAILRLGCMHRDKGQIFDASDLFKEGLNIDPESPDAWSLIGNLHLEKGEWGTGQKKFERILKAERTANDAYANVALGNVWLQMVHMPTKDQERLKRHQERALTLYKNVLRLDSKNIYAANGLGAVLAHRGYTSEARDIFSHVREATSEMKDVWFNLAHIYVEQKQFSSAIQMYKNAMRTFDLQNDPDCLTYLARALFKNNLMDECKRCLIKARRVAPQDTVVLYNLALVMQQLAERKLTASKSNLKEVVGAVRDLELSERYFSWLQSNGDRTKFALTGAANEARKCKDILTQAHIYVNRAKLADDEERAHRERTQASVTQASQKRKQREQERIAAAEAMQRTLEAKRNEYREKTGAVLEKVHQPSQKFKDRTPRPKSSKKQRKRNDGDDGLINDNESDAEAGSAIKGRKKKKKARSDDESPAPSRFNPKHKSREVIDDDSSSDEDFNAKAHVQQQAMLSSSEDEKNDATSSKEKKDTLASSSDEDARPANNKTALLASSSEEDNSDSGKKITSRAALESDSD